MCGIFGLLRHDRRDIEGPAAAALAVALRHRGPDNTGTYAEPGMVIGNNRLAIIDLASGNQPIFNEDGGLVIVFNGEIYNHRALRAELQATGHAFRTHSDTEVILHAFEQWGPDCVHRFNGMFAFIVWNLQTRELFLARDRLGIKPLYLGSADGAFAFASEPKALLPLLGAKPAPDWTAIHRFMTFGYFPLGDCAFAGIAKFPAGHVGWLREGRLETRAFWTPEYGQGKPISAAQAAARGLEVTREAVAKELESDVPVGVFLSGGLDSALVAHHVRSLQAGPVASFSLGFAEATHDETATAERIARHLGLEHRSLRLDRDTLYASLFETALHLDEPFGDSTVLPLLVLAREARREVKVALTGWGGDELFAGYPTYKAHRLARHFRALPGLLSRRLVPWAVNRLPVSERYMSFEFKAKRFVRGIDMPPEKQHFAWMGYLLDGDKAKLLTPAFRERVLAGTLDPLDRIIASLPESDLVDRIMHLDALTFLEGNGLYQADRMTMAASLEARVPLLNNDVIDFVAALPAGVKTHGGVLKAVLKDMLAGKLPADILALPKKGFGPPSAAWVKDVFAPVFDRVFTRERVEDLGLFRWTELKRLLDEHRASTADHGRTLWLLLSFQLWYDRWILELDPRAYA